MHCPCTPRDFHVNTFLLEKQAPVMISCFIFKKTVTIYCSLSGKVARSPQRCLPAYLPCWEGKGCPQHRLTTPGGRPQPPGAQPRQSSAPGQGWDSSGSISPQIPHKKAGPAVVLLVFWACHKHGLPGGACPQETQLSWGRRVFTMIYLL